jgi:DNA-binding LacI/PurR family transcriptional regulator
LVTLKDIAEKAGVSVMTVSRVINGHYSKVSKEKTEAIQKIIRESGYVVNSTARSLSSKSSSIIAVLLQGKDGSLQDPYSAAMVNGIIKNVQARGYYLMIHDVDKYEEITSRLRSWNAEGAIFLGTYDKNMKKIQEDNQIPLIFTDSYSSLRQVTNVGIDDYKGGMLAAKCFLEHGHTSCAFVGYTPDTSLLVQQRLEGFRDTLRQAGAELPDEHIIDLNKDPTPGKTISSFSEPVTAIFTTADIAAMQVMTQLKDLGYQIPRDYSIIGFDDLSISSYASPKLTTIHQDIAQKAKIACDILFKHINSPNMPAENICMDVCLCERQSVYDLRKEKE